MTEKEKKGGMTVKEAGHKGGEKTAKTHGHEFYEEIGHKGGEKGGQQGGPEGQRADREGQGSGREITAHPFPGKRTFIACLS